MVVADPAEPALFDVVISNEFAFFEQGPRSNVDRPLWKLRDLGYTAPTLSLRRDAFSLENGLQLYVDGSVRKQTANAVLFVF